MRKHKRKRIYIAGPISNVGHPTYNRPAFAEAESRLLAAGYRPVNPHDLHASPPGVLPWEEYMKGDIAAMLECDGIATLPGWEVSKGAKLEVHLAYDLGIPVDTVEGWVRAGSQDAALEWARKHIKMPAQAWSEDVKNWAEETQSDGPGSGFVDDIFTTAPDEETHYQRLHRLSPPIPYSDPEENSVTLEAHSLVNGPRQDDYGHPLDNFTQIGRMWAAILGVEEVTAEQVGLMMVAGKISRQTHHPKRDNLTDMAGYAETVDMVIRERERRAA